MTMMYRSDSASANLTKLAPMKPAPPVTTIESIKAPHNPCSSLREQRYRMGFVIGSPCKDGSLSHRWLRCYITRRLRDCTVGAAREPPLRLLQMVIAEGGSRAAPVIGHSTNQLCLPIIGPIAISS